MNICIVDDVKNDINKLCKLLQSECEDLNLEIENIDTFLFTEEFIRNFEEDKYDIIFLDIFIDNTNGIDLAHKIREVDESVKIVFVSSSNEFASESYAVKADYYILKPYNNIHIFNMLKSIKIKNLEENQFIILKNTKVIFKNIIYTEYENHRVYIHNKIGEDIVLYMKQAEIEEILLKYNYFVNCYKGIVANLYEVSDIKNKKLVLSNKKQLPISRRRFKEVQDIYVDFLFREMRESV